MEVEISGSVMDADLGIRLLIALLTGYFYWGGSLFCYGNLITNCISYSSFGQLKLLLYKVVITWFYIILFQCRCCPNKVSYVTQYIISQLSYFSCYIIRMNYIHTHTHKHTHTHIYIYIYIYIYIHTHICRIIKL